MKLIHPLADDLRRLVSMTCINFARIIRIPVFCAVAVFFVCMFAGASVRAQTTEFVYQGQLQSSSAPASGNFDFDFLLYDALTDGNLVLTIRRNNIAVVNGIFSVTLNFGANFPGGPRYLEIHVRPAGVSASFTSLTPRQPVTAAPYSIRSLNAASADTALNATSATIASNAVQLGGVDASQYVLTGDARLSDARNPLPNSASYIQNSPGAPQAASFNITGNAVQGLSANGLVKAMALVSFVRINSTTVTVNVVRCYNSVLNISIGNCGFTVSTSNGGIFILLDFGFVINDRFIALTSSADSTGNATMANAIAFPNATTAKVGVAANPNASFYIFVY